MGLTISESIHPTAMIDSDVQFGGDVQVGHPARSVDRAHRNI
jgi:acyl-[acyl carrier protein]--UDP-N-acetylglucosamine O-acyltransferase